MSEEWLGFWLLTNKSPPSPPQAPGQNWTLCTTICKADSDWGSFYGWGTRAGLEFYPQNKRFYVLVDGSVHPPRVSLLAWAARDAFNTDMIWIPAVANYIINCNPQKSVVHSLLHSTWAWDSIPTLYSKNRGIFCETNSISDCQDCVSLPLLELPTGWIHWICSFSRHIARDYFTRSYMMNDTGSIYMSVFGTCFIYQ